MNTNITKTWMVSINEEEVFSRCTNESLYQAYNRMAENPKGDAIVMQEDDRAQFKMYFASAIAALNILLARRMDGPVGTYDGEVTFFLQMHDNHDDSVLPILISHCYDYVVKKVLEQWFHVDFDSELERYEINHCLHYRKHPVRRRIGPLF